MEYRVGIIGCGRIASEFEDDESRGHPCTHAGVYNSLHSTVIVAACDNDSSKLTRFSNRWGVEKIHEDHKKMISSEKIDILSVCTPPEMHAGVVIDAARSKNIKVIFCEKPMATSVEDARKMVEECKRNNVHLVINHSRRWDENYIKVKEIIKREKLGRAIKVNARYTSGVDAMGTHMIDLLVYFFGEPGKVFGVKEKTNGVDSLWYSENYKPDDHPLSGIIWFKNGIEAHLLATCKTDYPFFEMDILTTRGKIKIKDHGFVGYSVEIHRLGNEDRPKLHLKNKYESRNNLMLSAVKDVITTVKNNKDSISSGEDALKTLLLTKMLIKSSHENRIIKGGI